MSGQRSLRIGVSGGSARDVLRLVASAQSGASLAHLSLDIFFFGGSPDSGDEGAGGQDGRRDVIALAPGYEGITGRGLPQLRTLQVMAPYPVVLLVPMPYLELLVVSGLDDEMGGVMAPGGVRLGTGPTYGRRAAAAAAAAAAAPPLFPALRQDLTPASIYSAGLVGEMGEVPEGWDIGLHSNNFAPLLAAAAPAPLTALDLCLGEAPDAPMQTAMRALTRLTSLRLRFADAPSMDAGWMGEGGEDFGGWDEEEAEAFGMPPGQAPAQPAAPAEPKHAFDCRLLTGMAALEEFSTSDGGRLEHPAALARLPTLRTLRLPGTAALPALAPHLPHLTCLELERATPQKLAGDAAACAALRNLRGLRRVAVGTPPTYTIRQTEASRASDRQAMSAIAKHL
ncbi:ATP-binding protein [Chlorella sorokiniana]|uniref:ATP-binding protein n=1 Tax=Chlorella sorokiniana TaxID=3076 RepID=A0A2P6U184_CHLSO|nr:ATP-binding protein [Chlorella sorokiniana]|eukprot:PRW60073.1 ATP-binding protein [Chlorella sorokiniana]